MSSPPEIRPRPRPLPSVELDGGALAAAGSPAHIQDRAMMLLEAIHAGSVDGDSFAGNVKVALEAMGVEVPPPFLPMIAGAFATAPAAAS